MFLDRDVAKGDRITMSSKSEITFGSKFARMPFATHVFVDFRQIGIQDHRAV